MEPAIDMRLKEVKTIRIIGESIKTGDKSITKVCKTLFEVVFSDRCTVCKTYTYELLECQNVLGESIIVDRFACYLFRFDDI